MAKLNIVLDTETNTLSADIDGTPVDNCCYVSVENWGEEDKPSYHFAVTCHEKMGDVTKMTRMVASESFEGKAAIDSGIAKASLVKDYVKFEKSFDYSKAIEELLSRNRV